MSSARSAPSSFCQGEDSRVSVGGESREGTWLLFRGQVVGRWESSVSWDMAMPEGHQTLRQDGPNILSRQNTCIFTTTSWKLHRFVNNVHSFNKRDDKAGKVWNNPEDTKDVYYKSAAEPTFLN